MRLFIDAYYAMQIGCDETVIKQFLSSTYWINLFILCIFKGKLPTLFLEHIFNGHSFVLVCTDPHVWYLLNSPKINSWIRLESNFIYLHWVPSVSTPVFLEDGDSQTEICGGKKKALSRTKGWYNPSYMFGHSTFLTFIHRAAALITFFSEWVPYH